MVGQDQAKVIISDLKSGTYEMKLTVTDDKHLQGSDTVKIHVKKGIVYTQLAFTHLWCFARFDTIRTI